MSKIDELRSSFEDYHAKVNTKIQAQAAEITTLTAQLASLQSPPPPPAATGATDDEVVSVMSAIDQAKTEIG